MADSLETLKFRLADRYAVEREVGKGGMATVFLAHDIRHERDVAIKVLHPELASSIGAERFEREIKVSARLQHPHILGLIDSGNAEGLLYYVMPFIKGESLRDRLEREGQLPIDDAIQITLEVADALGYAHAQGLVHRDIKPENIMLTGGHALVTDFGIARAATAPGAQRLTQTGMAVGTPVYMSPEQAVGDNVGPTSDLYSLGCMLYEMLAGEPPFNAKSAQALMARHSMEAVPSIRIVRDTVPEEVEDAIFAAMAKVPADRPQTAAKFTEILGAPIGTTASLRASVRQSAARRVSTGARRAYSPQVPWWKRRGIQIGMGGAVLVLAAGAFLIRSKGGGAAPGELERARRLAVMYFAVPEGSSDLRSVADRITEGVIATLSRIPELKVRSAQAVAPFGTSFTDSIGTALDVGSVITGSVDPSGNGKVRISTTVVDAGSGAPIKRTSTEIPRDSLFAAEDSVAGEVARSLRQIVGSEINLRESRSRTSNLAAWTAVQRADRLRKDALDALRSDSAKARGLQATADSLLGQAASADTRWIEPLVLRGGLVIERARLEKDVPDRQKYYGAGLGYARQALQIDGRNAAALELQGALQYAEWRLNNSPTPAARKALLDGAENDLLAAVNQDPARATAYVTLSRLYYDKQDVTEAHNQAAKAYEADRYLINADFVLDRLFYTAYDTHSFTQATKWCDEGAARFPRDYRFTLCRLWLLLVPDAPVDVAEAWRLVGRIDSLAPLEQSRVAHLIIGGAIGKTMGGAPNPLADSAKRVLERARVASKDDPSHELEGYEAVMRVRIGDYPEALRLLTRYVASNPDHSFRVGGDVHWWWEPLRQMPQFQRLLAAQSR